MNTWKEKLAVDLQSIYFLVCKSSANNFKCYDRGNYLVQSLEDLIQMSLVFLKNEYFCKMKVSYVAEMVNP